jgi:hypothetical protein
MLQKNLRLKQKVFLLIIIKVKIKNKIITKTRTKLKLKLLLKLLLKFPRIVSINKKMFLLNLKTLLLLSVFILLTNIKSFKNIKKN